VDPVSLTGELVSYDTTSDRSTEPLCDHIARLLEPLGADLHLQRKPSDPEQCNLLARIGPDVPGGLCLSGHMDTVPWDPSMRATTTVERDGELLYGRGTCDMKGAIAAMVWAARANAGAPLRRPLWLAFTFEEEVGCHGIKLIEKTGALAPRLCIVGEPTGMKPVVVHKGYVTGRFELRGVPCHSSAPDEGASALLAAARAVDALYRLGEAWRLEAVESELGLEPGWTTLNVGLLSGGSARNIVAESAELSLEMRPVPDTDPDGLLAKAVEAVHNAARTVPGVLYRLTDPDRADAFRTDPAHPLVQWLAERTGQQPGSVPYYTEAPTWNAMGATTCICGPGAIAQAHRVDEHVEVGALQAAADLYASAIQEFCR
jgi:acetylornithine deacetylase